MLVAPCRVHLLLAELFELPAVADVVGVPSMEEAERLAGVADVVFVFAGELTFRLCREDRRLLALVVLRFGLGVGRG